MPGKSGIGFLQAVRETYPDLPFILFTGKGSESVASHAIAAGVTDYLQKGSGTEQYELLANRITNAVEARHATQGLRAEREFIQQALDALDDLFYVLNEDGTVQRWNERVVEATGYGPEELDGLAAVEWFPEEDQQMIAEKIETVFQDGNATVQADLLTSDGDCIPYEWSGARLTDTDGETTGLVGIGRDITERKERKQELTRTRDLMSHMEQLVDAGIWEYDAEQETLRITDGTRQFFQLGPDEDPTLDKAVEMVHPADREALADRISKCLEAGQTHEIDARLFTPDGGQEWVDIRVGPVTERDADSVIRGYFRDMTERKEYERELEAQNERLEEFTSVVSHDLRNPLSVADGYLELARKTCESPHLAQAADAIGRMDELIEELLTLARAGDDVSEVEPVRLQTW